MEVHKHSHHVSHKKKWGEYLLEFFMLFLAVFLGFVAENMREHIAEHNRAREYAISLVQDLQHDTTAINVQSKSGRIYVAITDSLLDLSKKLLEGRNAANSLFIPGLHIGPFLSHGTGPHLIKLKIRGTSGISKITNYWKNS